MKLKEEEKFSEAPVFEGMTSIRAAIAGGRQVLSVMYDRERAEKHAADIEFLRRISQEKSFTMTETDENTISSYALGTSHGGIIAFCGDKPKNPVSLLAQDAQSNGFYAAIDGIEDPYNFGYSLRSLCAFGVCGVILPERNWMTAAGIVARSSAGASETMKIYSGKLEEAVEILREKKYRIVSSGLRDSVPAEKADLSFPLLLIIGGERRGISSSVEKLTDFRIRIDYGKAFSASLSAASASAVLAYEICRQNRK